MKKFISFALVGAMLTTALPVTAFAAGEVSATAKILGDLKLTSSTMDDLADPAMAPELQLKIKSAAYTSSTEDADAVVDVTLSLENAEFLNQTQTGWEDSSLYGIKEKNGDDVRMTVKSAFADEVTFTLTGKLEEDDIIYISLASNMLRTGSNKTASVSIESDLISDDVEYVGAEKTGIKVSIGDSVKVAEEEEVTLGKIKITSEAKGSYKVGALFTLTLNKGFEFTKTKPSFEGVQTNSWSANGSKATFKADGNDMDMVLKGIEIRATTAEVGDVASISIKAQGVSSVSIDGAKTTGTTTQADKDKDKTTDKDDDDDVVANIVNLQVPVGEYFMRANGEEIILDAPAYINAGGYTMLPVRAVAKAFGLDEDRVKWDATARTVTIANGTNTIVMKVGDKAITVNGKESVASSAVEISGSRAFLPMRDLAKALGISDISWDRASRIAGFRGEV